MPTNETVIAVPITVEQKGQTRQFLVRLVEKLDIVLGYRGGDPYATTSNLTQLEQIVLSVIERLFELDTSLADSLLSSTANAIEELQSDEVIADADITTQTISDPPTQAEVSNLASQVASNATTYNDLLNALRETGIIAT